MNANKDARAGHDKVTLKKRFMNLNLRTKALISVYSCFIVLFIVLTFVLLILSNQSTRQTLQQSKSQTVAQINENVHNQMQAIVSLADYFAIDPSVQSMLHQSDSIANIRMPTDVLRRIINYTNLNGIVFYNYYGNVIDYVTTDNSIIPVNQPLEDSTRPYGRLVGENGVFAWEFVDSKEKTCFSVNKSPRLVYWRIVRDVNNIKIIGAIAIMLDSQKIAGNDAFSGERLLILDAHGKNILNSADSPDTEQYGDFLRQTQALSGVFTGSLLGSEMEITVYQHIPEAQLLTMIVYTNPPFMLGLQRFALYILVAIVLFVLLMLPIMFFVTAVLTRPLHRLMESMLEFTNGDFDTSIDLHYNDEIGVLGRVFNIMVQENKRLIETTYISQLREREAELNVLQAQINPHFLYNLITTIHWNTLKKGDYETADIAYSMGRIFQITLSRGDNFVPLEQEKELVEYYLKLQKFRYRERLVYTIDIEQDSLVCRIPKLLIQPLVENAIVHGGDRSTKPLHIGISVKLDANTGLLHILVEDDGQGISPELLARLPGDPPPAEHGHGNSNRYALRNIDSRLQLSYPGKAKLYITSEVNVGTQVSITLPSGGLDYKKSGGVSRTV